MSEQKQDLPATIRPPRGGSAVVRNGPQKPERKPPTELQAMGRICNLLEQFGPEARVRMLLYVNEVCAPKPAPEVKP